jgi:hypothetical protein
MEDENVVNDYIDSILDKFLKRFFVPGAGIAV